MLARDLVNLGNLALDLDQALTGVHLLVQRLDLARPHFLREGNGDGRDDSLEPRRNVRHERDLELLRTQRAVGRVGSGVDELGELVRRFALVDVVRQSVGLDPALERLGGDLGLRAGRGSSARIARDAGDGRGGGDVGEERGEEDLGVGCEAARVRDALGGGEGGAVVELCEEEGRRKRRKRVSGMKKRRRRDVEKAGAAESSLEAPRVPPPECRKESNSCFTAKPQLLHVR